MACPLAQNCHGAASRPFSFRKAVEEPIDVNLSIMKTFVQMWYFYNLYSMGDMLTIQLWLDFVGCDQKLGNTVVFSTWMSLFLVRNGPASALFVGDS